MKKHFVINILISDSKRISHFSSLHPRLNPFEWALYEWACMSECFLMLLLNIFISIHKKRTKLIIKKIKAELVKELHLWKIFIFHHKSL